MQDNSDSGSDDQEEYGKELMEMFNMDEYAMLDVYETKTKNNL